MTMDNDGTVHYQQQGDENGCIEREKRFYHILHIHVGYLTAGEQRPARRRVMLPMPRFMTIMHTEVTRIHAEALEQPGQEDRRRRSEQPGNIHDTYRQRAVAGR